MAQLVATQKKQSQPSNHPPTNNKLPETVRREKSKNKNRGNKRMINYDPISITNPLVILTIIIIAIIIMLVCFYILPEKKECPLCKGTRYINKKVKPK